MEAQTQPLGVSYGTLLQSNSLLLIWKQDSSGANIQLIHDNLNGCINSHVTFSGRSWLNFQFLPRSHHRYVDSPHTLL